MTLPTIDYLTKANEDEGKTLGLVPYAPCNLRCPFCCTNNGQKIEGALPFEFYEDLVRDSLPLIGLVYVLSMGELLLKPDHFFKMVEPALRVDKPVVVFTNGTGIDKKLARRLVESKIGVIGKLYSCRRELNEQLSGDRNQYGKYVKLDANIEVPEYVVNLQEAGIKEDNFALNTVIVRQNVGEIASMRRLLREKGITHFAEFPDISGRIEDEAVRAEYDPSPEERERVAKELSCVNDYHYNLAEDERHFDIRLWLYRSSKKVVFKGPTGSWIVPQKGKVAKGIKLAKDKSLREIIVEMH